MLLRPRSPHSELIASVVLHLSAMALLALMFSPPPDRPRLRARPIEIVLEPSSEAARGSQARPTIRLKDLALPSPTAIAQATPPPSLAARELRDGASGLGAPIDLKTEARQSPLHRYVYDAIDGQVTYPAELKLALIQGEASARLRFSAQGEYLEEQSHFESPSSPYLKVLAARAVRLALREPIPSSKRTEKGEFEIECLFRWQITEHDNESLVMGHRLRLGKALSFYRNFHHSVAQWELGPLSGLGPFWGMDLLWFVKKGDELLSKKAKFDPLDAYRNDRAW